MIQTWDLRSMLNWLAGYLQDKCIPDARLEAELLLAQAVGEDRLYLYTHYDKPLTAAELAQLKSWLLRRVAGESIAAIFGEKEFMGLSFRVTTDVLVPRADTETLVTEVLAWRTDDSLRVLDIGTGSGAIIGSLLHYRSHWQGVAVDLSPAALAVAADNFAELDVASRVTVRKSDLFQAVTGEKFDILVSNPPYIPTAAIETLSPEVRHEPQLALDGGHDGLDVIRRLIREAADFVVPGGLCAIEIGYEQGHAVQNMVAADGRYTQAILCRDLGGRHRVVVWEVKL